MTENSCEYMIKQKTEGKLLLKKLLLIFTYGAFAILLSSVVLALCPAELYFPLLFLVAALTAFLVFVTWRFTCVEFEVTVAGGDLMITTLYGKGFRRRLLNLPVNSIYEIGEYDDKAYEEISKLSLQKDYLCLSSLSAPDVYYALFEEDKEQCILYFDAPPSAVALLKKYNSGAFRASAKRIQSQ